jgi:ATP-dependent Clp protease ATP-binding subunit ClpA
MNRELHREFGFESVLPRKHGESGDKLERIGKRAVRKKFSPEFINRIDAVVTYQPLDSVALKTILDHQIDDLQNHIQRRLGDKAFTLEVPSRARKFLLEKGTSPEYGARELKRTLHQQLTQPLASMLAAGGIHPDSSVRAEVSRCKTKLVLRMMDDGELLPAC